MNQKETKCSKCGTTISESKEKICANCGAKLKKPFYQKWWFWVIVVLGVIIVGSSGGAEDGYQSATDDSSQNSTDNTNDDKNDQSSSQKTYEVVDLQTMLDDLENNAMKAESTYQNKYVQVSGKIANFDSDGSYISIEPVNADEWNFDTVMCYIKNDSQRQILMEKSKGDVVTIKGKIITIGEVLGYSINIDQIN